jgi:hypothetical protein
MWQSLGGRYDSSNTICLDSEFGNVNPATNVLIYPEWGTNEDKEEVETFAKQLVEVIESPNDVRQVLEQRRVNLQVKLNVWVTKPKEYVEDVDLMSICKSSDLHLWVKLGENVVHTTIEPWADPSKLDEAEAAEAGLDAGFNPPDAKSFRLLVSNAGYFIPPATSSDASPIAAEDCLEPHDLDSSSSAEDIGA